jgi:hypothetical protein
LHAKLSGIGGEHCLGSEERKITEAQIS